MAGQLIPRMLKALRRLEEETDYEDYHKSGSENDILKNKLAPGVGDKTISDLLSMGFTGSVPRVRTYLQSSH
jgi:hypothetical protein